jgi:hypothetical protein
MVGGGPGGPIGDANIGNGPAGISFDHSMRVDGSGHLPAMSRARRAQLAGKSDAGTAAGAAAV